MKWKLALRRDLIACLKTIDELVNVICIFLSFFFQRINSVRQRFNVLLSCCLI